MCHIYQKTKEVKLIQNMPNETKQRKKVESCQLRFQEVFVTLRAWNVIHEHSKKKTNKNTGSKLAKVSTQNRAKQSKSKNITSEYAHALDVESEKEGQKDATWRAKVEF